MYDAVRVLESKGLVEIQHQSPQQFRAVPIAEAAETLQAEFENRIDNLQETIEGFEPATPADTSVSHEVWGLSGEPAIQNRTIQLIDQAETELVFVITHDGVLSATLVEHIRAAQDRNVTVLIGTISEQTREDIQGSLPDTEVFVSGLEWLGASPLVDDDTEIRRLMLVDRSAILVSSSGPSGEQAVFGEGFDNGLVAIARRLMATGLLPIDDPQAEL